LRQIAGACAVIDLEREQPISMAQAAKLAPGRPNIATLWRWRTRGVAGVQLETLAVGGRRFTTVESLYRFIERVTAAKNGGSLPCCTNRQREADQRRAKEELRAAGLIPEG
jgi:hypothetical protein